MNYTVQSGDNVIRIAHQFGLDVSTVLWANPVLEDDPDLLAIGQDLKILPVDGTLYTVLRGDSVEAIAAKHKVEVSAIVDYPANGLSGGATLQAGQVLVIPGGEKPYVPKPTPTRAPRPVRRCSGARRCRCPGPGQLWPMQGVISWVLGGAARQPPGHRHRRADWHADLCRERVVSHVQWNLWPYGTMVMIARQRDEPLRPHVGAERDERPDCPRASRRRLRLHWPLHRPARPL